MLDSVKIIKNRSDIGAGTRGSDMGIDAIEIAAINKENNYFEQFEFVDVNTENESIYNKVNNSFAKRIGNVLTQCTRLSNHVKVTLQERAFPIVLSGDHSSALGTISGVKAAFPRQTVGVVWIDAHADIHSPYTSPSGNIHGMPLAAALSEDNLDFQINDINRETSDLWERMKNVGVLGPKVAADDVVYFGVRDTEEPEDKQIENLNIKNYTVSEIRFRGLEKCVDEAIEKLSNCDVVYVSFDVDSMDCIMVSKGTGTPVENGLSPDEARHFMNEFAKWEKVNCMEVVEINPCLDEKINRMAEVAYDILEEFTQHIEKRI